MLANTQGLNYLRNNYKAAFVIGPDAVALDESSSERVVKVKFQWRASAEGYREIEVAFRADGLIRRMTGVTATNNVIQFDFTEVKTNQGILEERFKYNPPPSAYTHENFLFGVERMNDNIEQLLDLGLEFELLRRGGGHGRGKRE